MSYFIGCVWATSHIHPSAVILDTVVAALTTERTAAAEAASIPEWRGRGAHVVPPLPSPPPPFEADLDFSGKGESERHGLLMDSGGSVDSVNGLLKHYYFCIA